MAKSANYTKEKNIVKSGETVRGASMYKIVDSKGNKIHNKLVHMDWYDAVMWLNWINDRSRRLNASHVKEIYDAVDKAENLKKVKR